jgi:cobyrinic acid a,c-diamide synthase
MLFKNYPRIIIGGLAGDSGKTFVTCGLLACFKSKGINVSAFKKGPDYIDSAWLSLSSGKPARNLDTFMMGFQKVIKSFQKNACNNGINIIEGNRGLFDGVDSKGTHSTAELAKLLESPIIIVQDITKVTRTAAASIVGCLNLDREIKIAGVILNRVAGERHAMIAKNAIEGETGIPVLGMIPKLCRKCILPERHLGLITPDDCEHKSIFLNDAINIIEDNVDVPKIMDIAVEAPFIEYKPLYIDKDSVHSSSSSTPEWDVIPDKVKIGYLKDKSFSFYYPENLEMLAEEGAELIPISSINRNKLDDIDALYIGGGFPEINLADLASDKEMIVTIKKLADYGLPIYAECGGLMYLAKDILWKGKKYSLTNVLPLEIKMHNKPYGHGYCEMTVDNENPFYDIGTVIRGHEFHYSEIYHYDPAVKSSLAVSRGCGCFNKRDGLTYKNVFASYIHVHALATPEWAIGMINCARNYHNSKKAILEI